jgi:hypothetical protein
MIQKFNATIKCFNCPETIDISGGNIVGVDALEDKIQDILSKRRWIRDTTEQHYCPKCEFEVYDDGHRYPQDRQDEEIRT